MTNNLSLPDYLPENMLLNIFPLNPKGNAKTEAFKTKHGGWKKFQNRRNTEFSYNSFENNGLNSAYITGAYDEDSKQLIIIDIDVHKGKSLSEIEIKRIREYLRIKDTFTVQTGGGGIHFYYYTDSVNEYKAGGDLNYEMINNTQIAIAEGNQRNKNVLFKKVTNVDVRAQGGLVFSERCYFDGNEYKVINPVDVSKIEQDEYEVFFSIARLLRSDIAVELVNNKSNTKIKKANTNIMNFYDYGVNNTIYPDFKLDWNKVPKKNEKLNKEQSDRLEEMKTILIRNPDKFPPCISNSLLNITSKKRRDEATERGIILEMREDEKIGNRHGSRMVLGRYLANRYSLEDCAIFFIHYLNDEAHNKKDSDMTRVMIEYYLRDRRTNTLAKMYACSTIQKNGEHLNCSKITKLECNRKHPMDMDNIGSMRKMDTIEKQKIKKQSKLKFL